MWRNLYQSHERGFWSNERARFVGWSVDRLLGLSRAIEWVSERELSRDKCVNVVTTIWGDKMPDQRNEKRLKQINRSDRPKESYESLSVSDLMNHFIGKYNDPTGTTHTAQKVEALILPHTEQLYAFIISEWEMKTKEQKKINEGNNNNNKMNRRSKKLTSKYYYDKTPNCWFTHRRCRSYQFIQMKSINNLSAHRLNGVPE